MVGSLDMSDSNEQKAILIDLVHPRLTKEEATDRVEELEELVNTYGGLVIVKTWQKRFSPHPHTFIGTGKVDELGEEAKRLGVTLLIVNAALKPRQVFELGERLRPYGVKVWDRIDLILKIFSKHAKTAEARLEIELAAIKHMGPRIFGMGMELSRQGGGTGARGAGESNTEKMKRHLRQKEKVIKQKLEKFQSSRALVQAGRKRRGLKTVSIVGNTNAGKTTLLNALTGSEEYAADALFATLDTRVGSIWLEGDQPGRGQKVLVSDTIGFIKDLPPELLNAFSSTLSEAVGADVLLHVVDASDDHVLEHMDVVEAILERLGAHEIPRIVVFNKMDQVTDGVRLKLDERLSESVFVWVSALEKKGLDDLLGVIGEMI